MATMIAPFTAAEGSILVRLLIAHCLTDFFFQSSKGVKEKETQKIRSLYLLKHVLLLGMVSWLALFNILLWKAVIAIVVSHYLIDLGKLYVSSLQPQTNNKFQFWLFIADQALHVSVIILVWLNIVNGWQRVSLLVKDTFPNYQIDLRLLGFLIVTGPVSYMIRFLTARWADDLEQTTDGLKNAGLWIGVLERILILTLVYMQQYTAIGFLVTAKSILRLIDRPEAAKVQTGSSFTFSARKHTEYVLIGTFLSFLFAITTGLFINWLVALK